MGSSPKDLRTLLDFILNDIEKLVQIQPYEYVSLIATFNFLANKDYNCSFCKSRMALSLRDQRKACVEPKKSPLFIYKSIKFYRCPSNFYNPMMAQVIDMFSLFSQGVLPFNGGLFEQPCKIIDLFSLISNLRYEKTREHEESQKKWQTTKSPLNFQSKNRRR